MSEWHPREYELAQVSQSEPNERLADHLQWCSRCRGITADYAWLEEEIAAGFEAGLKDVAVPPSRWERVDEHLRASRARTVGKQLLAVAGAALIACLMLLAPSILNRHVRAEGVIGPTVVPVRVPVSAHDDRTATGGQGPGQGPLTTTPGSSISSGDRGVSLPFSPPPEPPEPEA